MKESTRAGGSDKKRHLKEGEIISLTTVSLEDLFYTLVVDAYERHDVATFYVPGEYLHSDMRKDKSILMNIRGDFVDILCQVNPEYGQHMRYENEKYFCVY